MITVGSRNRTKSKNKIDTTKVFNPTKCVIHLIDTSLYKNTIGDDRNDDEDVATDNNDHSKNSNEDIDNSKIKNINQMITDQHMELWSMMKRGDLVEDISLSGYRTKGRYVVDKNDSSSFNMNIIRNGLSVVNLNYKHDKCGTLPNNMYTITEFLPGYFDDKNLVVNDYFCPGEESRSSWNYDKCAVYFDTDKLKLNNIKSENITHLTHEKKHEFSENFYNVHYLYLQVKHIDDKSNKICYLLYGSYSDEFTKQNIELETKKIIKRFSSNGDKIFYPECVDQNILNLAKKLGIDKKNILNVF